MSRLIRVAYAEDHRVLLDTMSMMLNQENDIRVLIRATDGKELLDALKKTEVDIVLLDLDMPGVDGRRTFSLLKQFYPTIRIIIVSMHFTEGHILKFMSEGACAYLSKGEDFLTLRAAIRSVFLIGIYMNGKVTQEWLDEIAMKNQLNESIFEGDPLTKREKEVLLWICKGKTNGEISALLYISQRTVENHRVRIYKKIGSLTVAQTVLYAIHRGIYQVEI